MRFSPFTLAYGLAAGFMLYRRIYTKLTAYFSGMISDTRLSTVWNRRVIENHYYVVFNYTITGYGQKLYFSKPMISMGPLSDSAVSVLTDLLAKESRKYTSAVYESKVGAYSIKLQSAYIKANVEYMFKDYMMRFRANYVNANDLLYNDVNTRYFLIDLPRKDVRTLLTGHC